MLLVGRQFVTKRGNETAEAASTRSKKSDVEKEKNSTEAKSVWHVPKLKKKLKKKQSATYHFTTIPQQQANPQIGKSNARRYVCGIFMQITQVRMRTHRTPQVATLRCIILVTYLLLLLLSLYISFHLPLPLILHANL